MRREPTAAESFLWNHIRRDRLGVRMRRQYVIGGQIPDFYCPALKFAIEVDGSIHSGSLKQQNDANRDQYLQETYGIQTLRLSNQRVLGDIDAVIHDLLEYIQNINNKHSPPPQEEGVGEEVITMDTP